MACRDLWKEYFKDPSHFRDDRNSQRCPKSHKELREPLWMDGGNNPPWVKQELRGSGVKNGEFCVWNARDEGEVLKMHSVIKACGKQKDLQKGSMIHAEILERGLLEKDISLGNALLSMYAKSGAMAKAQELFDELPTRNVVTWNALITGYAQHGLGDEALNCFGQMQDEGLSPNAVTFICILKACGSIGAFEKGEEIHAEAGRRGLLEKNIVLGTALVDMYAKCGAFAKAQEVFDQLPARDVASWTALIYGFSQHGLGDEALRCFRQMRDEGLPPNAVTFICTLKACSSIRAVEKGEEIHAEISRQGFLENDIVVGNALVDMYAKCGALAKAQEVFDDLPSRNVATWNGLITGYAHSGLVDEALNSYGRMKGEGISPDAVTFNCILEACSSIGAAKKGEEIHAEVVRQGLLEKDIVLGTTLVDMYAKCGMLAKAQGVFDELPARNVTTWTALIAGYARHGLGNEALSCCDRMRDEGLSPNSVTFICVLKACSIIGASEKGEEIHAEVNRLGFLEKDILLGTALVDMYAKCGLLAKAQEVFDELPARDVASWTALIDGYVLHGLGDAALSCFRQMEGEGLSPNAVTFICVFKACGSIGAAEKGEEIHAEAGRQGLLDKDIMLGSAVVDMYAKCGMLAKAQNVFDELPARHVASWNALMAGYAQVGKVKMVSNSFVKMLEEGIEPNVITFIALLTACSHAGLVQEGQMYFDIMSTVYYIIPTLELCTCMVDIFSRAGHFDKAISVIEKLSPSDGLLLWPALLGVCQKWENVELGRWAFEHVVKLDKNFAAGYVCMSNLYAAVGMQEEGEEVENWRMINGGA